VSRDLRADALAIWSAGVAAADPYRRTRDALGEFRTQIDDAERILVVGGGKAGAAMAAGLEAALANQLDRVVGLVNVPEGLTADVRKVRLHTARPAGSNHPTAAGVAGSDDMLRLLASAGPDDVVVCLLSGGGSALLPAPAEGISLDDKQAVTRLLHQCGATIHEMNGVRKHLSRVKGGRLAEAFRGRLLLSLIVSDVVGDPLDVIASGPTATDPTTFADALSVLDRFHIRDQAPGSVVERLERGVAGEIPETAKVLPPNVLNLIIANNESSLAAARTTAQQCGYRVINLGSFVEGETRPVAVAIAGIARSIREDDEPTAAPACLLIGGETTVTLAEVAGKGGRNQEFVLAATTKLGADGMEGVAVLSGGTDGEDGPTDAAGAVATADTLRRAAELGLSPEDSLRRHDAYPFFDAVGGLIRTGLTGTNVMDLRVILVS
jgi:hydroxypyruvate reductase/glycerate 2-kinase